MRKSPLAIDPELRAARIPRHVVIAGDVLPIPPAGLDALGLAEKLERSTMLRLPVTLIELLRLGEQPQRSAAAHPGHTGDFCARACARGRIHRQRGFDGSD